MGFPSYPPIISWAASWINADDVWAQGYKGDGVAIGFIDNGFDYNHVDLTPNHLKNYGDPPGNAWPNDPSCGQNINENDDDCNGMIDDYLGWDFTSGGTPTQDNNPIEEQQGTSFIQCADPNYPKGGTAGHGTATLSVSVGAGVGDGTNQQATGVAPHAWFVPIKNGSPNYVRQQTCCSGSSFPESGTVDDAMAYALSRHVDLVVPETQLPTTMMPTFRIQADVLLEGELLTVAPAGNFAPGVLGPGFVPPPWIHPRQAQLEPLGKPSGVLTVGALKLCNDDRREGSGHGPVPWDVAHAPNNPEFQDYYLSVEKLIKPDVMAPGVNNLAAASYNGCFRRQLSNQPGWPADAIYTSTGATSGATPVVAGAALLMLCKDNELTPAEIDSILETTASNYSPTAKDRMSGSGTINALAAVNATEFFNHFDGMFTSAFTQPESLGARVAEASHWIPHLDSGTPSGQWRFVDVNASRLACDGVLEGEAPLSKRSLTTVQHDRQSYRIDFDFEVKSFPSGGGHLNPLFGAALRYNQTGNQGLYVFSRKASGNPTQIVLVRKQAGDPEGGVYLAQANVTWDWAVNTPFSWHIWDDGSTITLTADRPGFPSTMIMNHVPYTCIITTVNKGLLVEDGTKVQFDNVRIEGFQPVSQYFPNTVISRYVGSGNDQAAGGCPANGDPVRHPGGTTNTSHAGDYWIQVDVKDIGGRPLVGYWDVKVNFNGCMGNHVGMPPTKQVYADEPTDVNGRTVIRKSLAFGGSDPCGYSVMAGGQVLKPFTAYSPGTSFGFRNVDITGDGVVANGDLSRWQLAWIAQEPRFECDLNLNGGLCDVGDLQIFQLHFTEHQNGGSRPIVTEGGDKTKGASSKKSVSEEELRGDSGELYLTVMDRLPAGAPMPPVAPHNAVTTVGDVGPGGRDITVGLYAAGFQDLAGAHVRCRWPEGWELVAVGDSLVSGQIFGTADRYWTADRSFMTAFDCVSDGPIAIGRFDLHVTRAGTLRFDQENALIRTVDCRGQQRDLVNPGTQQLESKDGSGTSQPMPAVQLVKSSPTVSAQGAEFTLILGKEVPVSATVYDVAGRVVKVVADQVLMPPGEHRIVWDGTSNRSGRAGSGVYIIKIVAEREQLTESVVLLR
jgi:hypothetical protein